VAGPSTAGPRAAQTVPADQATTSAVALAADPSGFDHAFYRGQDGAVYERTFRDGVWSAQTGIGGKIVGAPAAAFAGTTLIVAVRGTDGALWLKMNSQGTWSGWQNLGGVLSAAPAVTGGPTAASTCLCGEATTGSTRGHGPSVGAGRRGPTWAAYWRPGRRGRASVLATSTSS
jgi:hypothetical protein